MPIGVPAAMLIGSAVAGGASIASGAIGAHGASSAADTQAAAADRARQETIAAAREVNPQIQAAVDAANPQILAAADRAATGVTTAADRAATGVDAAVTSANALLDPYASLGADATNALRVGLSDFNKMPTMADLEIDPGFAFRLQEGEKALARSAAVRGGQFGGAAQKALARYSQGVASDEYAKAFERYRQGTNDRFTRMYTAAGVGRDAAITQGNRSVAGAQYGGTLRTGAAEYSGNAGIGATNLISANRINAANTIAANTLNAARGAADYTAQAGNAAAAGQIGAANAWAGGINGAGSSVMNALLLSNLLNGTGTPAAPSQWGPGGINSASVFQPGGLRVP